MHFKSSACHANDRGTGPGRVDKFAYCVLEFHNAKIQRPTVFLVGATL